DAWAAFGRERDVCLTPVLEGDEPRQDPQLASRGVFAQVPGSAMPALATPVRVDGPRVSPGLAPALGADSDAVLGECGFTDSEIGALREAGIVGAALPPRPGTPSHA
ncbi:MAG: hypothetical protein ACJ79R_24175, partial [Anaeromyxobacteraceae bacterium]